MSLREKKCEKALLRSSFGTKRDWHVKINERRFEDGWKEFAKYHELHVGDFLVFRHAGDLVFDVMVFDPSCCEREYSNFVHVKQEIESSSSSSSSSSEEEDDESDLRALKKQKQVKITIPEENVDSYVPENPYFLVNLTAYGATSSKKHIPMKFAMENGLRNRHGEILLVDEEGRSWVAEQKYKKSDGQDYIGNGWRTFCTANYLKEGDTFFLELTHKANKPVFKMTRLKRFLKTEKDGSSSTKNPKSSATMKATYGRNGQPKIPRDFARRNNLTRRHAKMILINEGGSSWLVSLVKDKSGGIHMGHGWSVFAAANGIREGDAFMLQLVKVGHMPVMRIYGVERAKKRNMENNQTGSLEDFEDVKGIIVKDVHSSRIEASSFSKPNQNSEEV
ncbi:putative B3 domain-containing protein REM15 [Mercurialis annua]|uniref:putative B3 domain-containing protein REM15 n=1 Tax=Mercurialis annua TaxID=3986 RepID=UPI0024AD16B9|nr:putative B3 domain-containing protein REM15 [Mercurialis annua]